MTNDLLKICFILLFLPHVIFSLNCEEFLTEVFQKRHLKEPVQYTPQEEAFVLYTDSHERGLHLGKKEECESVPLMKYFIAMTLYKNDEKRVQEGHAICLPHTCSNIKFAYDQAFLLKIFTEQNWFLGFNQELHLHNPEENTKPRTPLFYITCIIFAALFLLAIFSTLKVHLMKKELTPQLPQFLTNQVKYKWVYESFDLKNNLVSLYQTAKEQKLNENIAIFNFLRVVTSIWVIWYHSLDLYANTSANPQVYYENFRSYNAIKLVFTSGDLSVEYFFVMTGFLVAYTLVPKLKRQQMGIMSFFTIIKHRFLRIYPAMILAFLVWWQVTPNLFTGQLWFLYEYGVSMCDQLWLSKILLYENIAFYYQFEKYGRLCMLSTWYIPTEFQMYIFAVIALAIYAKWRRIGFALTIGLICLSLGLAIRNSFKYDINPWKTEFLLYFKFNPFTRLFVLFVGVVWGLLYYEYSKLGKKNIFYYFEKKPIISYISIISGVALNARIINDPMWLFSKDVRQIWFVTRPFFFAISITLIFMPLASNRKFYIKTFFNLRIFQIMGKLSYMLYLYNDEWIKIFILGSTPYKHEFSLLGLLWLILKITFCTQLFSILPHLILEKPLVNMEGQLSKSKNVTSKEKKIPQEKNYIELPEPNGLEAPDQKDLDFPDQNNQKTLEQSGLELVNHDGNKPSSEFEGKKF